MTSHEHHTSQKFTSASLSFTCEFTAFLMSADPRIINSPYNCQTWIPIWKYFSQHTEDSWKLQDIKFPSTLGTSKPFVLKSWHVFCFCCFFFQLILWFVFSSSIYSLHRELNTKLQFNLRRRYISRFSYFANKTTVNNSIYVRIDLKFLTFKVIMSFDQRCFCVFLSLCYVRKLA